MAVKDFLKRVGYTTLSAGSKTLKRVGSTTKRRFPVKKWPKYGEKRVKGILYKPRYTKSGRRLPGKTLRRISTKGRARVLQSLASQNIGTAGFSRQAQPRKRGRVGRPRGTYKYRIPGKGPVDVFTYRRWLTRMRALQRLSPEQYQAQIQAPIHPQIQQQPLQRQQVYQQPLAPQQAPIQSQSILRPAGGNILHAPNFMKGELVGVQSREVLTHVDNLHRPVNNPRGDYYVDIDPASGKPMLRKRISERWLTNK